MLNTIHHNPTTASFLLRVVVLVLRLDTAKWVVDSISKGLHALPTSVWSVTTQIMNSRDCRGDGRIRHVNPHRTTP